MNRSRNCVEILLRSGAPAKLSNRDSRTLNITNCKTDNDKRSLSDKHNFEHLKKIHSSVPRTQCRTRSVQCLRLYVT